MEEIYKAIVIGAGPAGYSSAMELKSKGYKTIILNYNNNKFIKSCGGLLSKKTLDLLPSLKEVEGNNISKIRFYNKDLNMSELAFDHILGRVTDRIKLDLRFRELIKEKDIPIEENVKVLKINQGIDINQIVTDKGTYSCQYILGCDGVTSITAKLSGIRKQGFPKWQLGLGVSLFAKIDNYPADTIAFLTLKRIGGLGWIFPYKDMVNIGIGSWYITPIGFKKTWEEFERRLTDIWSVKRLKEPQKWLLPPGGIRRRYYKDRIFLCGDAAGVVDPFSGEGIYQAILSGKIAAQIISESMDFKNSELYQKSIENRFLQEQRFSLLTSIILSFSPLKEKAFSCPSFQNWVAGIMDGSCGYKDLLKLYKQELWNSICKVFYKI